MKTQQSPSNTDESPAVKSILFMLSALGVAVVTATAQQAPPTAKEAAAEEMRTITLSPFEVSVGQDSGYVGQDTLAGSRLRTNLRDIPAAISAITAEFISDIAAVNVEDVMEYAVGTRMEVEDGRAAPVGENVTAGGQPIRIRGLAGGGRSINFFQWGIFAPAEIDTYMVESAELSRGPNSILFGIGSPAGRFNVATKQARTDRPVYSLSHRIDSWSGQRWIVDANLPLVKDRLAVRAVGLRGRDGSWRAGGHNDQDRFFLAAKWQPDRKTSVRVEFEDARIDRFTSRPSFGIDLRSIWEASGRPIFDNFAASYVPGTPSTGAAGTPGNPIRDTGPTDVIGTRERNANDFVIVSPSFAAAQNYRRFTTSDYISSPQLFNDFEMGRANPKATPEANWVDAKQNVRHGSLFITRELVPNLNLELAFNRMVSDLSSLNLDSWGTYGVAVDTNRYLPNGQLKPPGQLYHYDVSQEYRVNNQAVNQYRAALGYERTWRDDLVRLRLAGLGERSEARWLNVIQNQNWLNGPSLTSGGAFAATPEANRVHQRLYIADLASIYDPNFRIPGPIVTNGSPVKYQDPRTGAIRDIYPHFINRNQGNTSAAERENNALMAVAQVYLFTGRFVGTFGYREDEQKQWVGAAFRDPAAVAPNIGVWLPGDPRAATPSDFTGRTKTLGGVFHVTPWASVFYNTATSLGTPGTIYVAPADPAATVADLVTSPEGITQDYGVKLSLLNKRLFLTAAQFHTEAQSDFAFSGFGTYRNMAASIWGALESSGGLNAADAAFAERQKEVVESMSGYLVNSESKGLEVEVVGRITDAWSLSVNYTKMESKRAAQAREFRAYLDHHKAFWKRHAGYAIGQDETIPGVELAPSSTNWRTPAEIAASGDFTVNSDSINETIADIEAAFFLNPYIFEGTRFIGDPKHSINLRTRYDVREGRLKGLSVGLGTRLRYGRVSGARTVYTFASGTDYTDAYNGRIIDNVSIVEMTDQNVWDLHFTYKIPLRKKRLDWRVQLNVNNVLDETELVVTNIHPVSLVPLHYRYQNPRQFILTNTVSF